MVPTAVMVLSIAISLTSCVRAYDWGASPGDGSRLETSAEGLNVCVCVFFYL